jgi:hypothetical protein
MYFLFERGDKERGVGTPLKRPEIILYKGEKERWADTPLKRPEIILFKARECKKNLHPS